MTTLILATGRDLDGMVLQARAAFTDRTTTPPSIVLLQPDGTRVRAHLGQTVTIHDDGHITVTNTKKEAALW